MQLKNRYKLLSSVETVSLLFFVVNIVSIFIIFLALVGTDYYDYTVMTALVIYVSSLLIYNSVLLTFATHYVKKTYTLEWLLFITYKLPITESLVYSIILPKYLYTDKKANKKAKLYMTNELQTNKEFQELLGIYQYALQEEPDMIEPLQNKLIKTVDDMTKERYKQEQKLFDNYKQNFMKEVTKISLH